MNFVRQGFQWVEITPMAGRFDSTATLGFTKEAAGVVRDELTELLGMTDSRETSPTKPEWNYAFDGEIWRVYRNGEPLHFSVEGDSNEIAALILAANASASPAPTEPGLAGLSQALPTESEIVIELFGDDPAIREQNPYVMTVALKAARRLLTMLERKLRESRESRPPVATSDEPEWCVCVHKRTAHLGWAAQCEAFGCSCRAFVQGPRGDSLLERCDKAARFAGPGWWCSRDKGHEGPCAAHPPSIPPAAPAKSVEEPRFQVGDNVTGPWRRLG